MAARLVGRDAALGALHRVERRQQPGPLAREWENAGAAVVVDAVMVGRERS